MQGKKLKILIHSLKLSKTFLIDIEKYFQRSAKFSQGLIVNYKYFRNVFHLNLHNNQGVCNL